MAALVVQSSALVVHNGDANAAVTLAGVTAGNAIVITGSVWAGGSTNNPMKATDGATALSVFQEYTPGGNYGSAIVAWELNVAAGSHTITVQPTTANTGCYFDVMAHEVSGLGTTQPSVTVGGTTTGTTLALSGATPAQNGCIIFTVLADDGNAASSTGAATTPSGYTSLWSEMAGASNQMGAAAYEIQTTAAPVAPSWTGLNAGGGAGWAAVAVAFAPTGGGPTPVNLTGISRQQATNTASLTRSVLLSSTSQQQASVLGALMSQVLLAGTSQQAASAFGVLTDTLSLTAISAQEAVAFAALSIGNPLSGVSGAQSAALASLLVAKGFSGITQAGPTASANLTVTAGIVVALTGVSFARNSAFGALTGVNALVGVSAQSQVAYGQRSVTLQGVSSAVQSAYAALSILLGASGISSAEASARAILTVFAAGSGATLMSTATPSWVMTYDSLTQAVLQSLERSDTSTQNYVPTAITMAEFEIAQQIKTLGQLEVADTTLSPSNPILAKPARWRKTVSMTLVSNGLKQPVLLRKLEYLSAYAQSVSAPGTPLFYADYDYDHWMFAPTPDIAYAVEALVYTRLEPLSSSNQTNWLTQNAPNAMLFGALKQMMLFLKDDQRLAVFKGMFDEAMSTLKTEDTLRVGDRSAVAVDS